MAKKCQHCGLINFDYEEVCKRCSASLNLVAPPAYKWFVVYCVGMAVLYLVTAAMGIVFMVVEPEPEMSAAEATIFGAVLLVMGLVFMAGYALGPLLPRKNWTWIFGLVLICIGLTSACCLPVCIPLLIHWLKPEMKAFYGRDLNPLPPPPPPQWT